VPAILAGYLFFPLFWSALNPFGARRLLLGAFVLSATAYTAVSFNLLIEFSWYFVIFNEAFNFCLGIVLGRLFSRNGGAELFERLLGSRRMLIAGLLLAFAGNVINLYDFGYPFSSSIFTLGLAICGAQLSRRLSNVKAAIRLSHFDSYLIYLVHQPFAFPMAVVLAKIVGQLTAVTGLLPYFTLVFVLSGLYESVCRRLERWETQPGADKALENAESA